MRRVIPDSGRRACRRRLGSVLIAGTLAATLSPVAGSAAPSAALSRPPTVAVGPVDRAVDRPVDRAAGPTERPVARAVLAVSIDALNPAAIRRLGRDRAPTLHRLMRQGAWTFNARTVVEETVTLPNHTSMVTDRPIDTDDDGHGVDWNDDRTSPSTVHEAAGEDVSSVFREVHEAGRRTAMFTGKPKLGLFERSWATEISRDVIEPDTAAMSRVVRLDIRDRRRAFRFVHFRDPDAVGHEEGFMSTEYLAAVARVDRFLGGILRALWRSGRTDETVVVVTSDHGGEGDSHDDPTRLVDYRVPFIVKGPGVARRADLYDLNPRREDPGTTQPDYDAADQPIRNAELGNLALDVLGLDAVEGSTINDAQDLRVR